MYLTDYADQYLILQEGKGEIWSVMVWNSVANISTELTRDLADRMNLRVPTRLFQNVGYPLALSVINEIAEMNQLKEVKRWK